MVWAVLSVFSLSLTYLWWAVIQFYRDYNRIPSQHLVGNRLSNVAALKEDGFPFSFLVIGDTYGDETAETLMEMALKKDRPAFIVNLGDFVKKPDLWNHRFFLTEMAAEMKPAYPVFLVAGNHDIDYKHSIKTVERRVTPEIYESLYGPMNFDFIFNDCLFVLCGVDLSERNGYLNYLDKTLSEKGKERKYRFVFIHYPPRGLADHIKGSLPIEREEEFFSLLESHQVTACFFGDYHGYWRGQRKGVAFIVSGGGGRLKPSQPEWGKFHHIMKMTVDKEKVSEDIITVRSDWGIEDLYEEWVFTSLFPLIGTSREVYYLIFGGILMLTWYCLFKLGRTFRTRRLPPRLKKRDELV